MKMDKLKIRLIENKKGAGSAQLASRAVDCHPTRKNSYSKYKNLSVFIPQSRYLSYTDFLVAYPGLPSLVWRSVVTRLRLRPPRVRTSYGNPAPGVEAIKVPHIENG